MSGSTLADAATRHAIATDLGATLFVEAGAGSGKTKSLVDRVVATVLAEDGIPLRQVAAVTFTEKAAAELRDRLRGALEVAAREAEIATQPARARRAEVALDDLDAAAIGTLHSFAQRLLGEHPIEAGLPPVVEVLDEVASQVAFAERWTALSRSILDDAALREVLLLGLAAGMKIKHLRSLAHAFNAEWDRLETAVLSENPGPTPRLDVSHLIAAARELIALRRHCTNSEDRFLQRLDQLELWVERLAGAPDAPARMRVLADADQLKSSYGRRPNWRGVELDHMRTVLESIKRDAAEARGAVVNAVLRRMAYVVAQATIEGARGRQRAGRLEFHDLLVLARELVCSPRHGAEVRAALQQRYQRLLLDEFQDTDPIQIELAVRIAGGAEADAADWRDVVVPAGRVFVVGDPKQSIYRFRRADIATYLDAQSRIGRAEQLVTNFRSTRRIVDWVNHVFARLISPEPGSQPPYLPLAAHRHDPPSGSRLIVLGSAAHAEGLKAEAVRELEAADVAAAIQVALAQGWQVLDRASGSWRPVRLEDIAVLVPARTSLPMLESALDGAGIPYRAEASSLVYRTDEVRDLLMTARAVDDPSDALALVAALRSPLFGCGDDDLWTWKLAGGSFNLLAQTPDVVASDHPVRLAVTYLRSLHRERTWRPPSELLDRLVRDRRMLEVATTGPRTRDVWRRLRFVVDQARAWSEAEHGGLRAYLAWARLQGDESARVAEAVLPETDASAVRVLTIHAAKGLEFPVVIVSGLSSLPGNARGDVDVVWPRSGGYELKVGRSLQTGDFDVAKPIDEQMDHHERLRLLYVACTRARDHLVVSLHRARRAGSAPDPRRCTNAELLAGAAADAAGAVALPSHVPAVRVPSAPAPAPPPPYQVWHAQVEAARAAAARPAAISASSLEGGSPHDCSTAGSPQPRPDGPGPDGHETDGPGPDGREADSHGPDSHVPDSHVPDSHVPDSHVPDSHGPDSQAPDRQGREGLESDPGLAKGARNLELPPWNKGRYGSAVGRAVHGALQTIDLATGAGTEAAVAAQALAEGVLDYESVVLDLCRQALTSETVQQAARRPHWRETYVGTTLADGTILEGFVDLIYRDDEGSLVIVDYKTDAVPVAALPARVSTYLPQMAAYASALGRATGQPVARTILLFLSPGASAAASLTAADWASAAPPGAATG